ncbi:6-phosphogluconolactonase [Musca vetustissima]|uniref:6-phosphogluconolactonase n=1 Tax=Musca vetustissima TaxID=27455 RepID=UPI002AB64457|nr:6-phosphogluconolactonase [Musca vetustissima]
MNIIVVKNEAAVIERLKKEIEDRAEEAVKTRGVFRVGLSGGSLVNYLSTAIQSMKVDLSKWQLFFCDERFVAENDNDSTYGVYKSTLIPKTSLKEEQFIWINLNGTVEECAQDYEKKILQEFDMEASVVPRFDLLLLGMGPDGHTCSLFPGHKLLEENHKLIAAIEDSPKPPPKRVTMTLPLINNASCCLFAMCGEGKAEMVKRVFVDKEPLPAGLVQPTNGDLICILDEAAGKYVK